MATCEHDCLSYEACKYIYGEFTGKEGTGGNAEYCKFFKDRAKYINVPGTMSIADLADAYEGVGNFLLNFAKRLRGN
jgi:hypothetical protein